LNRTLPLSGGRTVRVTLAKAWADPQAGDELPPLLEGFLDRHGPERQLTLAAAGHAMSTAANLLAQKQQLLERLHGDLGPNERAEIERLLVQIDAALDLLEEPDETADE
jgi:hypothetical protein